MQLLRYEPATDNALAISPLAAYLVERACKTPTLANDLYWQLTAESEDVGSVFLAVREAFLRALATTDPELHRLLVAQAEWFGTLMGTYQAHFPPGDPLSDKYQNFPPLKALKACAKNRTLPEPWSATLRNASAQAPPFPVPLPTRPSSLVTSMDLSSITFFPSSTHPVVASFNLWNGSSEVCGVEESNAPPTTPAQQPSLLFKRKEDIRMEAFALQLFRMVDRLLLQHGIDLRFTHFQALAMGRQQGLLEYIPGTTNLMTLLPSRKSRGLTVLEYLQRNVTVHHEEEKDELGVSPSVMDDHIRSLAGVALLLYLWDIGDRHIGNYLMLDNGRIMQIDFGGQFLGGTLLRRKKDIHKYLLAEMVDGIGGQGHANEATFRQYFADAMLCLRQHADVLLGMLQLMGDAALMERTEQEFAEAREQFKERFLLNWAPEDPRAASLEAYFASIIQYKKPRKKYKYDD